VLLNDTVATLLAGRAETSGRRFDSYIGFILGTGTNTAYVEQNANIKKATDLDPDKSQIVNVESGGFGKAPRGKVDPAFDAASVSPGVNTRKDDSAFITRCSRRPPPGGLFSPATAERLAGVSGDQRTSATS
jgi:hexokinase